MTQQPQRSKQCRGIYLKQVEFPSCPPRLFARDVPLNPRELIHKLKRYANAIAVPDAERAFHSLPFWGESKPCNDSTPSALSLGLYAEHELP